MNNINSALNASKHSVNESKSARIQQEHARIIELVKSELGIADFKCESVTVRESVKALILEMWTPENGLTAKGTRALNEGAVKTLTDKSTDEQVRGYCKRVLLTPCRSFINGTYSKADLTKTLEDLRKQVSDETKRNFGKSIVDDVFACCMYKVLSTGFGVKMGRD